MSTARAPNHRTAHTRAEPPSATQRLRLTACLALVALPHVFHLPFWVLMLGAPLIAWQALAAWRDWPQPGRMLRFALACAAFAIVFAGFGRVNGQDAGVSLLLLMLALKISELDNHRDAMVFLALLCFLLITQFLFSQSLAMAAYLALGVWLIVAALVDVAGALAPRAAMGESARLLLHALPVAALLFVLFPRIPGPLWGLPADSGTNARSGLSDRMSPGSITNLALSAGVALRARFGDAVPPPGQRYWRGPVLWDYNGESWSSNAANRRLPSARLATNSASKRWKVAVTLEATRHDWLIALDVPAAIDRKATRGAGAMLRASDDIDSRTRYVETSVTGAIVDARLPAGSRRRALLLPSGGNPKAHALAQQWLDDGLDPQQIVRAALRRFREQPYIYTLSPAATPGDSRVDAFLFDTREGFCEHYAGAFTFLMRAADVPARVVTGYQGAEKSLVGDYWIVRNADAHAWSEVWLAGRGWVRVDPTAAVAPQRVESGVAGSLSDNSGLPFMARAGNGARYRLQMTWDAVNVGWNRWFLAYGPRLQHQVLDALGLGNITRALLALTAGVTGVLALVSVWLGWQMRRRRDPDAVVRAWQRVCRQLAAAGHARRRNEGPRDYTDRIAAERADLGARLRPLVDRYLRLRYGRADTPQQQRAARAEFIAAARAFSPRRSR